MTDSWVNTFIGVTIGIILMGVVSIALILGLPEENNRWYKNGYEAAMQKQGLHKVEAWVEKEKGE